MPEPIPVDLAALEDLSAALDSAADAVYWQPRVQAGDLSSHIYNAWLTQLIETGRTQGLVVVRQTTNILFDLMLSAFLRVAGAEFAQRVSVSIAVLVFVWGAFRFITVVAGRQPWHLIPCIAMLAYGWVFHMGFFNFYLSLGLCFWALATAWNGTRRGLAMAAPLLALAYTGTFCRCGPSALGSIILPRAASPARPWIPERRMAAAMAALHAADRAGDAHHLVRAADQDEYGRDQVWVFDDNITWCWPASSWSGGSCSWTCCAIAALASSWAVSRSSSA